jgi:hypothetical protein
MEERKKRNTQRWSSTRQLGSAGSLSMHSYAAIATTSANTEATDPITILNMGGSLGKRGRIFFSIGLCYCYFRKNLSHMKSVPTEWCRGKSRK